MAASIHPGGYKDEAAVVTGLTVPLAVLLGAEEQLVNSDYFAGLSMPTLWRGAVQIRSFVIQDWPCFARQ